MFEEIREAVRRIPAGKVATYGEVARGAGYPRAARRVAAALRGGIDLPWHRVLAAGGRIALPGAAGLEQRLRLESEGVTFRGRSVDMKNHEFRFPSKPARRRPART